VTVLNALANAVASKQIPAMSHTLDKYIDVFAPRLSRALSADVPRAFQAFWRKSFQDVEVDFSDDVRGFLLDVLAAVPGMIEVRGLFPQGSMSEVSRMVINVGYDMVLKVGSGGEHRAIPECLPRRSPLHRRTRLQQTSNLPRRPQRQNTMPTSHCPSKTRSLCSPQSWSCRTFKVAQRRFL
jgi:hypothetical protein